MKLASILLTAVSVALTGCSHMPFKKPEQSDLQKFTNDTLEVGRALARQTQVKLAKIDRIPLNAWQAERLEKTPVVVSASSIVTKLDAAEPIGLLASELLAQAFTNEGFAVMEYRQNGALQNSPTGQHLLTPDRRKMEPKDARVVVTATYTISVFETSFNYKVIDSETGQLLAALTMTLPKPTISTVGT